MDKANSPCIFHRSADLIYDIDIGGWPDLHLALGFLLAADTRVLRQQIIAGDRAGNDKLQYSVLSTQGDYLMQNKKNSHYLAIAETERRLSGENKQRIDTTPNGYKHCARERAAVWRIQ